MEHKEHRGLSPSSLALFLGCNRKYFHKKVAKNPIDPDQEDDQESFQVGKAFHKVLEDSKHELEGLKFSTVEKTVATFDLLNPNHHPPMIFAMLGKYKVMHQKAKLKALACEVVIETDKFYGIVDVILENEDGWWIGDMKTAQNYNNNLIPTLPLHPQLNLYAAHVKELAEFLGIDPKRYRGCRYRLATKTKIRRAETETVGSFISRCSASVKAVDFIIPKELMNPPALIAVHGQTVEFIGKFKGEDNYQQNLGNCMTYSRYPCEFWSRCHGKPFTQMMSIESVSADE